MIKGKAKKRGQLRLFDLQDKRGYKRSFGAYVFDENIHQALHVKCKRLEIGAVVVKRPAAPRGDPLAHNRKPRNAIQAAFYDLTGESRFPTDSRMPRILQAFFAQAHGRKFAAIVAELRRLHG